MKKSDKKLEANIIKALTEVCETLKVAYSDFCWLTHTVSYRDYPASFKVIMVFKTEASTHNFIQSHHQSTVFKHLKAELLPLGIPPENIPDVVILDSEQACAAQHQGDWRKRLREFA
ncbi:Fis family transcriptional regulator [Alteromonas oceanisediminis]|uniref:Fis family transcriptional regulator n=1 Tax=Alteromonas oceanisediminis TaxID=2836180 RepID=UPI001BDAD4A5|nr:Fis family transcriptional regulator [Alteromonas oceanisediminis]MBT0588214.1 Fis family transcriptional regulator [Alteromonas oceanisediminis]